MISPHYRFSLYVDLLGLNEREAHRMHERLQLVPPGPAELSRMRFETVDRPKNLDPRTATSRDWLSRHDILDLFFDSPEVAGAFRVLKNPAIRRPVELLLLAGNDPSTTAAKCQESRPPPLMDSDVRLFRKLFWNTNSLSYEDLNVFLERHIYGHIYREALLQGSAHATLVAQQLMVRYRPPPLSMQDGNPLFGRAGRLQKADQVEAMNSVDGSGEEDNQGVLPASAGGTKLSPSLIEEMQQAVDRFDPKKVQTRVLS